MRSIACFICIVLWPALLAVGQDDGKIVATLGVRIDGANPGLLFNVVNAGVKPIPKDPLGYNSNRVVVLTPAGYVVAGVTIADTFGRERPMIAPGEQVSWEQSFDEVLRSPVFGEAGQYRMYWEYAGVKSREIVLVRREPSKENRPFAPKEDPQGPSGTPRGAFVAFLRSLDETAVHPGFAVTIDPDDPTQAALLDAFVRRAMRMGQLMQKIDIEKLPAGADPPDWRIEATPEAVAAIEQASQTFPEYFNECTLKGRHFSVRLVRDRGKWNVRVADLAPFLDRAAFDRTTAVIAEMYSEVDDGKYATAAAVAAALREKLKDHPDGTLQLTAEPATRPASKRRQLPEAK